MAAAWRYALTGVGAAIAPGSQKWKGMSADFEIAPTRMRMIAEMMTGPVSMPSWARSTSAEMRPVPVAVMSRTMPTSMARPPAVVTISACRAAWRERRRDWLWPMSR